MWYVIQTQTGRESTVKKLIDSILSDNIYEECIIIYAEGKRKYYGSWHPVRKIVFPGYIFLITDHIDEVYQQLKKVPAFTKLLGAERRAVPVYPEEEKILELLCGKDRQIEMSYGFEEGDVVTVSSGSLKGLESMIRKIDRHKRKCILEMNLLGEIRQIEVGLEILEKR